MVHGYILRGADSGRYKVGITKSLRRRYSSFRSHSAESLEMIFLGVLADWKTALRWESEVLAQHKKHALHGEWLSPECEIENKLPDGMLCGVGCIEIPRFVVHDGPVKTRIIGIRVDNEERAQFERAAKSAGKKVSDWMRDLGAAAVAPPIPTVQLFPQPQAGVEIRQFADGEEPKGYAAPASFGVDVGAFLKSRGLPLSPQPLNVGYAPTEDVPTNPWLPHLIRLQRMGEMDPSSSEDEFATLLRGEQFRPPKGWAMWSLEKRARWLDENKPIIVEGW